MGEEPKDPALEAGKFKGYGSKLVPGSKEEPGTYGIHSKYCADVRGCGYVGGGGGEYVFTVLMIVSAQGRAGSSRQGS